MIVAGIDIGSVATKVALRVDETVFKLIVPTGWSPRQAGEDALNLILGQTGLEQQQVDFLVATGYGRIALAFADKAVTEITCHARGIMYQLPATRLIIDIGGQDSKIIKTGASGQVIDFVMNDKCAAGTGRFLEVIATRLGIDVSELSDLATDENPVEISSMCTVFAESEVVGLLAQGKGKGEIIAGLHRAIARRIGAMAEKLSPAPPLAFTGGVAKNQSLVQSLAHQFKLPVIVPADCQFTGALGAMLIADELARKRN